MGLYSILRTVYHTLVPGVVRRLPGLSSLSRQVSYRYCPHDLIYDKDYYQREVEETSVVAAPVLGRLVNEEFRPKRIIDVGCGSGALLEVLVRGGSTGIGLEYADAGIALCRTRNLDVRKFDLEKDTWQEGGTFDLVISTEVAEHLPEAIADRYINLLTSLGPAVVFTAATVGQGGTDHVNEQPHEYWIAKFAARGYTFQKDRAERWRRELREANVAYCYSANLMIFRKNESATAPAIAEQTEMATAS